MCVFAWQTRWFTGGNLKRLREYKIARGEAHLQLQWGKLLWTHLWQILSKFACFAMEGSHRRLKHMLRNSESLSLLRGRLGLQVVVDVHTIGDSLHRKGWDTTKQSMRGQGSMRVPHKIRAKFTSGSHSQASREGAGLDPCQCKK